MKFHFYCQVNFNNQHILYWLLLIHKIYLNQHLFLDCFLYFHFVQIVYFSVFLNLFPNKNSFSIWLILIFFSFQSNLFCFLLLFPVFSISISWFFIPSCFSFLHKSSEILFNCFFSFSFFSNLSLYLFKANWVLLITPINC